MQTIFDAESEISQYFKNQGKQFASEQNVISEVFAELIASKSSVSNKDIIIALIEKLETENDIVKQDIYRQALEIVVQRTPDDITP